VSNVSQIISRFGNDQFPGGNGGLPGTGKHGLERVNGEDDHLFVQAFRMVPQELEEDANGCLIRETRSGATEDRMTPYFIDAIEIQDSVYVHDAAYRVSVVGRRQTE
jgi:hypothetical protein